MPNITLYGGRMGSSFRCHWMLAELGLAYENPKLDMKAGENRQPAYLAINPTGQVPAMVHDGFVVTESAVIVHYLAEKHNPDFFGPMNPESHATMMRWQLFVLLNIDKNFSKLASKSWGMPASPEEEKTATDALARFLPVLDQWLSSHTYLAGDAFTVADIVARSSFMYAEAAQFDLSPYASIQAWIARCSERPAFTKAKG